jgi:hypothetical protein
MYCSGTSTYIVSVIMSVGAAPIKVDSDRIVSLVALLITWILKEREGRICFKSKILKKEGAKLEKHK